MTRPAEPTQTTFIGAAGNRLVADVFGERGAPVLLLHGGGQTRHAWRATAAAIARAGHLAYALDQRGHGDSDWDVGGAYAFPDFAADVRVVAGALTERAGTSPMMIGASLGGIAALLAEGEAAAAGTAPLFSALVLVDITPRVDRSGVAKIQAFMSAHAREGFATVAEAADAVAAYLPHRPRPRSHEGLKKNLRLHADGRWRWHWDPLFIDGLLSVGRSRPQSEEELVRAARTIRQPTLLVRGASSEVVLEAHAREFLELVPHAEYLDVGGAQHMVAGDKNDQFASAILDFLTRLDRGEANRRVPNLSAPGAPPRGAGAGG
jgi:pimeloyl-ACP methyl ester carboxylesterase